MATRLELKVFNYAYDKNKVYHIKAVGDIDYDNLGEPTERMFTLLDDIANQDYELWLAKQYIHDLADDEGDLIKLIVSKDLDCGATATTVNKVHPGTVPVFKIQLAKEVPLEKVEFPCLAQIKYDGVRIIIDKRDKQLPRFFTRNGKEVNLPVLAGAISRAKLSSFILDTEVTLYNGKMEGRTSVSGMINSAMHGGTVDESLLVFNVFDALTVEEFDTAICLRPYRVRFKHAMFIMESMLNNQIIPALTIPCNTRTEVQGVYDELIAEGYEGLILKQDDHKYSFKRSKDWVKMKETKTADLSCLGAVDGNGKYEGMIGSLDLHGFVEGKEVFVSVGSGLSDEDRSQPMDHYDNWVIEIKYNALIQDSKTGRYSLFLPRFVCRRFDK